MENINTYTIKFWETEADRDNGISEIHESFVESLTEALKEAEALYYKQNFACVEVELDDTQETKAHFSKEGVEINNILIYSLFFEDVTSRKIRNTFNTNTSVKEIYQSAVAYDRKKDIELLAKKWDSIDEFTNDGDYEKTISSFLNDRKGDDYIVSMVALCSKEGVSNLKDEIIKITILAEFLEIQQLGNEKSLLLSLKSDYTIHIAINFGQDDLVEDISFDEARLFITDYKRCD